MRELIETPRLRLTRPTAADAAAIFATYASDPDVTKYVGFSRHVSVADTENFISCSDAEWTREGAGPYLVWSRAAGALLGSTGLAFEDGTVSTGYVLAKAAWGCGYASESLRAMVDLARSMRVPRLSARCHPDHRASRRVLEKCGFALDPASPSPLEFPNLAPGLLVDAVLYSRAVD